MRYQVFGLSVIAILLIGGLPISRASISSEFVNHNDSAESYQAGTFYYVAPYGSDSGPGTEAHPFRSIQRAADAADEPGDVVMIREGTYSPFVITHSGTEGAPITFRNYPGEQPVITGSGKGIIIRNDAGASYPIGWIVIEGLEVSHASQEGLKGYRMHNVVIRNCSFHHSGEENMLVSGSHHVTIDGCTFYNATHHDIYATGNYWTVSNSVFFGTSGRIMQLYPYQVGIEEFSNVQHWTIVNNTFVFNQYQTGLCLSSYDASSSAVGVTRDVEIYNNIFYRNAGAAINMSMAHPNIKGVVIHDNMHYGNATFIQGGTHPETEYVEYDNHNVDPRFVRTDSDDFGGNDSHLQPLSPAIDAGVEASDMGGNPVTVDADGDVRPQGAGYDIGAYEYHFGSPTVPPTATPTTTPTVPPTATPTTTPTATPTTPPTTTPTATPTATPTVFPTPRPVREEIRYYLPILLR